MTTPIPHDKRALQCMEIWGGNKPADNTVNTPGLETHVISIPLDGAGGDVHYVSVCGGGVITRIVLADIAGHGTPVAALAGDLRKLIRQHINTRDQVRLVCSLNEKMQSWSASGLFATSVVATYNSQKKRLALSNAGHPRPILFRARTATWSLLDTATAEREGISNLPLGILNGIQYSQILVDLKPGDIVLLYTDLLIETHDIDGVPLGEEGLLKLVRESGSTAQPLGKRLLELIRSNAGPDSPTDDVTLLELRHIGDGPRQPSARELLRMAGKFLHLIPA